MDHCHVAKGNMKKRGGFRGCNPNVVSVDRLNSFQGYTKDNIVLCRWSINSMKQDMPLDCFFNMITVIYHRYSSGQIVGKKIPQPNSQANDFPLFP